MKAISEMLLGLRSSPDSEVDQKNYAHGSVEEVDDSICNDSKHEKDEGPQTSLDIKIEDVYVPDDKDEFIDPRLKDYPIPLVAKTVDLHNDPSEPILTFRFWFLTTFWIIIGCGISTFYYFKPYSISLTSYAVQLLSWGMGDAMACWLPTREFKTFGRRLSLNPGPWNAKEHALIVVAYWGSCYTAYGLGPLSALELYYGKKISAGWSIFFLITTQMIGYGFAGIFRDILVRPPKLYYPGVLPNVALFRAMHKNPTVTKNSLKFFSIVAIAAFVYEWAPTLFFPLLGSLPLVCYFGHGNWIAWILGSGTYGFGILDFSLDWNYASFLGPLYTPLWANAHQIAAALSCCWILYPALYFTNTMDAQKFSPMTSSTYDINGSSYDIAQVLTPSYTLNQTAFDAYSKPYWAPPYVMYFFWGFAASTGAMLYSVLWYGKETYSTIKDAILSRKREENDPYLKLMSFDPRVPQWWYLALLVVCASIAFGCLYGAELDLPWWGFVLICLISWVFTFPNGILFGVANMQVGMGFLSEVIAGSLFPGKPAAVLSCMTYGRQLLEQNLNLISDYKFGFYMKIPEREMFVAQVYGTLLGPFINFGLMRLIIDRIGKATLTGEQSIPAWLALQTKNYYSLSVLWGILGPKAFFGEDSMYNWVYYGFLLGPAAVLVVWLVHKRKPHWQLEQRFNPVLLFYGGTLFPVYTTTNLLTSALLAFFFMGYMYRWRPVWFRKYNYLLGVGLDCGTELMSTVLVFAVNLPNLSFPYWWGNSAVATDRCFPPASLPAGAKP